jgi:uncharacterized protein YjbI with pentapeptide repeats
MFAKLSGANLSEANLSKANLSGATGLSLDRTTTLCGTIMPDGSINNTNCSSETSASNPQ